MKRIIIGLFVLLTAVPASAQLSVVQEERAKLTAPAPVGTAAAFEVTKRVAARVGGGVLKKPAGNNVDGFAVDIVCFANGTIVDILGDSEGAAVPSWSVLPETRRPDECQIPPPGSASVPPPVTVPPAGISRAELDLVIAAVRAEFAAAIRGQESALRVAEGRIDSRLEQLEGKPLDLAALHGAIEAALAGYEVNGKSAVGLGHQHMVKLAITKRK